MSITRWREVDWPRSGQDPVAWCCEHGPLICMKCEHVLGYMSDNSSRRVLLHGVSLVSIVSAAVTKLRRKRGRRVSDTTQLLLLDFLISHSVAVKTVVPWAAKKHFLLRNIPRDCFPVISFFYPFSRLQLKESELHHETPWLSVKETCYSDGVKLFLPSCVLFLFPGVSSCVEITKFNFAILTSFSSRQSVEAMQIKHELQTFLFPVQSSEEALTFSYSSLRMSTNQISL